MKNLKKVSIIFTTLLISCGNATQQQTAENETKVETTVVAKKENKPQEKSYKTEGSVNFQDISLAQAIDSAKTQGKKIFVNIHLKECTPCRFMEKKIFTQEKVGTYINERFISISLDGEEGEGKELVTQYKIYTFPTYLLIDTTSTKIGMILGADKNLDSFIDKIETVINPSEEKNEE